MPTPWTLLEKREQLAAAKLAAHENPAVPVYAMDLKNALCEVDADCGKLGHGWLLCSGRQHPNYGAPRGREQEPSTPSIENAFAKLKALLRKAAARTVDAMWDAIGRTIDQFTPQECANYFAPAGYDAFRLKTACLMTFHAEEARRNRWERVGALSTAARVGSGIC
jgi:hypothetical protein